MHYFGDCRVPFCSPMKRAVTPVGSPCEYCGERVQFGEAGFLVPDAGAGRALPWHRECFLRTVVGSLGHQLCRCSCYGGTEEDPPHLTRREAAIAAVVQFERTVAKGGTR